MPIGTRPRSWVLHGVWGQLLALAALLPKRSGGRKRSDQVLDRSDEDFRLLVEHSSDIISVLGRDGTSQYQSSAIRRVLDYAPEDRIGRNIVAHPTVLDRVLINLLSNATKFVAPGLRPQVAVWADERGDRVRLWIADNGIGILPQHQERVFGAFERMHGVEAYPGSGIGLAVVRRGIERMGGQVGLESAPGLGSRFWIEVPGAR